MKCPYVYHMAEGKRQIFAEVQQLIHCKAIMPGDAAVKLKEDPVLPLGICGA